MPLNNVWMLQCSTNKQAKNAAAKCNNYHKLERPCFNCCCCALKCYHICYVSQRWPGSVQSVQTVWELQLVSAAILQLLPLAGSFSITDNLFSSVATTEHTHPLADCPPNLHITNCYHALRRWRRGEESHLIAMISCLVEKIRSTVHLLQHHL